MMHESTTKVISTSINQNERVSDDIFYMKLKLMDDYPPSVPGQFVNVYLNDQTRLLPRPISIFDQTEGELHLVYAVTGEGTQELSEYPADTSIDISTPLGKGYTLPGSGEKLLIIGGGIGLAPLHYLAKKTYTDNEDTSGASKIYSILGFKDRPFLNEYFEKYCDEVSICTENPHDGFIHGNVMAVLPEEKYLSIKNWYTCGPYNMQKAISEYAKDHDIKDLQVSLEERMGCGFGTCVGCSIKTKDREQIIHRKVCKDGPVFTGSEVLWQ